MIFKNNNMYSKCVCVLYVCAWVREIEREMYLKYAGFFFN